MVVNFVCQLGGIHNHHGNTSVGTSVADDQVNGSGNRTWRQHHSTDCGPGLNRGKSMCVCAMHTGWDQRQLVEVGSQLHHVRGWKGSTPICLPSICLIVTYQFLSSTQNAVLNRQKNRKWSQMWTTTAAASIASHPSSASLSGHTAIRWGDGGVYVAGGLPASISNWEHHPGLWESTGMSKPSIIKLWTHFFFLGTNTKPLAKQQEKKNWSFLNTKSQFIFFIQ